MASATHQAMDVQALIQAAGMGARLGRGPKAFIVLDGRTLLERALDLVRNVATSVVVAVPTGETDRARALVGSHQVTFIEGGASRSDTTRRLLAQATAPWLLLHDVVHPFATTDLVGTLLQAAYEHRSAAPGLANTEFMYDKRGDILHAPGDVLVGQKPVAFSRDAIEASLKGLRKEPGSDDPSVMEILQRAGIRTKFVPGSSLNIKITNSADLLLAEAMIASQQAKAHGS